MYISHNIIHRWAEASVWTKRLSIFSQFSKPQIEIIVNAYIHNDQIHGSLLNL